MENAIIIIILLAIVAGSVFYLYRSKKKGKGCIGCPCSNGCGGKCGGCDSQKKPE